MQEWHNLEKRMSLKQVQAFIKTVLADERVQKEFPDFFAKNYTIVAEGRRGKRGCARGGRSLPTICLPEWTRNHQYVLHEMCHHLVGFQYNKHNDQDVAAHGREFAAGLLKLVQWFVGRGWSTDLKTAFKENKVKHRAKRKLSEEQRQALRKRMVLVRQAAGEKK